MPKPSDYLRLARPKQWSKSAFVLIGPLYGLQDAAGGTGAAGATGGGGHGLAIVTSGLIAAGAFAIASSACYVVNDILDAEADRNHPRKRRRPIASGRVSVKSAWVFAAVLTALSLALVAALPQAARAGVGILLVVYIVNVWLYSLAFKHRAIADVMSLSLGFVLRLLAGCAATAISPSTWLLNVTIFLAMFLSFGKRLGERQSLGDAAEQARTVQAYYTADLLRMAVVVTAVGTLVAYASYIVSQDAKHTHPLATLGFSMNWLWLTTIPATYGLLRSIVLLERGDYDDPTELATRDPSMIACVVLFAVMSAGVLSWPVWS